MTFAEMDFDLKNSISHRAKALEGIKEIIRNRY
jgi:inosine/xanthosine triphosphate pyrophosphatase family protein